MTLEQFQTLTARIPTAALRRAMAEALSAESPRTQAAYARFYCRVLEALGVGAGTDCRPRRTSESRRAELVA